jgi:hypothetical protein
VVVDEAHIFCPEKGQAESAGAIIDLCTRGRKRGFCGVLATQRLSKLHKDAAAECNNKLIGRTGLDIDIKRALDELGLPASGGKDLRNLEPGEFFAYGPAISRGVIKGRIGKVETTHPKAGHRKISHRPAPTDAVRKVLDQLKDLPKVAEEEAKTKEDFQRQIKELKKQLLESGGAVDPKKELDRINKVTSTIKAVAEKKYNQQFKEQSLSFFKTLKASFETIITSEIERYSKEVRDFRALAPNQYEMQKELNLTSGPLARKVVPIEPGENITYKTHSRDSEEKLGRCENAILGFLYAKRPQAFTKVQIGAMTGYAHSSGGFNNALSKLGTIGAIERNQGLIRIRFDWDKVPQDVPHSLDDWVAKLGACERAIYQKVLGNPEAEFEKSDLANMTGYSAGSGGFNNALSRLNTLGLIARQNGLIRLNPEISNI